MKKIEILHLKPSELKHNFGNPRKCSKEKLEELKKSLEKFGDHDVIKIDENNNIISGNQRIKAMIDLGIDMPILCKKLIGYSEKELKAININSNEHAGEWDYDLKEEWEKDLNDFNFIYEKKVEIKKININPYEKVHILISIDINKIHEYKQYIEPLLNLEGIEVEQSQN